MAFNRSSVGIDIGAHSVKVVQLQITDKGAFVQNALYFDRDDLEARGVTLEDRPALVAFLKAQMAELRIPTKNVILGISGEDSILRYTSITPVPPWRLKIIMGYEVSEVAERVGETLASDFTTLNVRRDKDDEQVVLVALSKEAPLQEFLKELEDAGILVDCCVPTPLTLSSAWDAFGEKVDPDQPEDDLAVIIDIGHTNLSCSVILNDNLVFARSIKFGGQTLTESIANDLGIDPAKAEQLKIKKGTVNPAQAAPGTESLVNSVRAGATQIQSMIQASVRVCKTQTGVALPNLSRVILTGGATRLNGLASFLERSLKVPVELFKPQGLSAPGQLPGKAGETFAHYPGDFTCALGLAVSGVRESDISVRIIPEAYQKKRDFRERTLFLYIAAGLLILSLILSGIDGGFSQSKAKHQKKKLVDTQKSLNLKKSEMENFAIENGEIRERVNRILREVEITSFQTFIMNYFSSSLRPEIRLSRMRLDIQDNDDGTDFEYRMVADCIADNADQSALQLISELQDRLAADNRVSRVEIENSRPESTIYKFELVIEPAFLGYQG